MKKEELKQRRERLGLTQTQLAEETGVKSNTISRYETGLMEIPKWMSLVLEALEQRRIKQLQKEINN